MADAAQLDIPPERMGSQTTECQVESTSGRMDAFGSEGQCSEPTKQDIGCNVIQIELQEICKASKNADEPSASFSENVVENSHVEQLRLPPEDVSQSSQSGAGNLFTETPEQGHQSSSEHIQDETLETPTAMTTCSMSDHLQSISGNVAKNSLHEDPGVNSMTGKTSCSGQMSLGQTNNFGLGTSSSEPAEVKHPSSSDFAQNELSQTIIPVPLYGSNEQLQSISEDVNMTSRSVQSGLPAEEVSMTDQTDNISCSHQTTLQQINEVGSGIVHGEPAKQIHQLDSVPAHEDKPSETVSSSIAFEQSRPSIEATTEDSPIGNLEPPLENASKSPSDKEMEPLLEDATQNSSFEQLETPSENALENSNLLGHKVKQDSKSRKTKYKSRSFVGSDRVLRSRTGEKPKDLKLSNNVAIVESSNSIANVSNGEEKKRKKRKKIQRNRGTADEYARIRRHLRYFLNRINYEKSLIDAYSGEGWKGSSLEKLKPEKELQRATSEILRRKLKIRDLFQRLDSLCAEGMFPESLFDSEGQIDSEDIFCAKCGSKEVSLENDIILCDGACDRGFHQFCLEPPLLSEDIPPDDEGWLCPGCDCKVDCIDVLNDSQGTELSVTDSWEKVFPEAAAAGSVGQNQEHNHGFPSDDSDDNDYDPDGPETDDKIQEDESSSDESEYTSASDGLKTAKSNDEQYLGLPSDDSEDDDYNPDAPDLTEDVKQESSSSDFTSDSDDLGAALDNNNMSTEDVEDPNDASLDGNTRLRGSGGQSSKRGQKKNSLRDELLSLLESGPAQGSSAPASGKRHIESLDYKKLHDETYGNVSSDSSDDEDWNDTATPGKRKKGTGQVATRSPKGNTSNIKNGVITKDIKPDLDGNEKTSRRTRRKSNVEDTSNLTNKSPKGSTKSGSTSGRAGSSRRAYNRLGEAVTQRLYKSFKENQYPDRSMKESLAQELGLLAKQVGKWFENARHFLKVGGDKSASENDTHSAQRNKRKLEQGDANIGDADQSGAHNMELPSRDDPVTGCCSGDVKDSETATPESSRTKPITPTKRKRKRKSDDLDPNIETPKPPAEPETHRKGSRVMTRRSKSVA